MSPFDAQAFDAYEAAGWESVAAVYDEHWSEMTSLAIDPLLDAAAVERGFRVLDVGTGAGHLAAAAAERGATATGVDVAAAMVDLATKRHRAVTFVHASVTELPFEDESFDAVLGNIVIQHVGEPDRAAREIARVLARGGRAALSTWDAPDRSPFFAAILGVVAELGIPPPREVPPGPSFFQLADDDAFSGLLAGAGLQDVRVGRIALDVPVHSAPDLVAALVEGTVRTGALLRAAPAAQRERIDRSLETRLEPWRRGDSYVVPASMAIASGRKPS